MAEQLNFSNNILNQKTIEGLVGIFEGDGIFDFWFANVGNPDLSETDRTNLRRNFPRANYLREVILKLCWSIPAPKICVSDEYEGDKESLEEKIEELLERRRWEGEKSFYAALPWWRAFAFVTGDVCVKLPVIDGEVFPERMPSQNMQILMDPDVRKNISGFRFRYYLGSSMFTDNGDATNYVVETITKDSWSVEKNGKTEELPMEADIFPVAHMAWEEREDHARGLPLSIRISEKMLHVLTVDLDRRLGNKMGSVPMYVLENAQGTMPNRAPGAIVSLKQENPWAKPDFRAVASSFSDASLRSEYVDALRELHETAFLPFELDQQAGGTSDKSGKALQMLSKDQVKYRESFQLVEAAFLEDLIFKCMALEGHDIQRDHITIQYEGEDTHDANETLALAQFYMDAGLPVEAFMLLGKEEKEAEKLAKQVDDKKAQDLLNAASALEGDKEDLDEDGEPVVAPKPAAKKPLNA